MLLVGRIFLISAILLMPIAYSNFAPTALGSDLIADYIKNHFVREMIFGLSLAAMTIMMIVTPLDIEKMKKITIFSSIVILPFWVARSFGWSTGGIQEVWGPESGDGTALWLHGPQLAMYILGLSLLWWSTAKSVNE